MLSLDSTKRSLASVMSALRDMPEVEIAGARP